MPEPKVVFNPYRGSLGYANVVAVVGMLSSNQAIGFEAVLLKVSSLIRGVPKPIRRIPRAFTTLQNFMIDLETEERSAFAVFPYSNNHAHAPNSTPTGITLPPQSHPFRHFPNEKSSREPSTRVM
jgi:hypothetical protein